ncbi:uncharacterized protein LOC134205923 isoform X2 [Armigeres subalbatus]|uniref:uncharacterized protein LOC134205923 isoform X2 n=1 Tax=Armigeres subalbatus TaxID=124917 RepID=UPI002ED5F0D4
MKIQFCMLLVAVGITLVMSSACNIGLGVRETGDFQVHTLYATSGPVPEAQNMSLIFDYQVSPVDTLQVTHVSLSTSLQSGCETSFPTTAITNGFRITVTTQQPVTSFYGTATVFGIRRG